MAFSAIRHVPPAVPAQRLVPSFGDWTMMSMGPTPDIKHVAADFAFRQEFLLEILEKSARPVWKRFKHCGFRTRTIHALVANGIDTPELVLEMPLSTFRTLSEESIAEVKRYRAAHTIDRQTRTLSTTAPPS